MKQFLFFILVALYFTTTAHSHSGRTNSSGCHTNRKTGDYHCHNSGTSSKTKSLLKDKENSYDEPHRDYKKDIEVKKTELEEGNIIEVKDGDTVIVSPTNEETKYTCRLYGIDAPEYNQKYGKEARKLLQEFVLGHVVYIEKTGEKTYNREVCIIRTKYHENINLKMVDSGMAWAYKQYLDGPYASKYIDYENGARESKKGLWKQNNPKPPWEFRNKN